MSESVIKPNYGDLRAENDWTDCIRAESGEVKPRSIYYRPNDTSNAVGINVEDVDAIIAARDAILKVQQEWQRRLPDVPGLYADKKVLIRATTGPVKIYRLSEVLGWLDSGSFGRNEGERDSVVVYEEVREINTAGNLIRLVAEEG